MEVKRESMSDISYRAGRQGGPRQNMSVRPNRPSGQTVANRAGRPDRQDGPNMPNRQMAQNRSSRPDRQDGPNMPNRQMAQNRSSRPDRQGGLNMPNRQMAQNRSSRPGRQDGPNMPNRQMAQNRMGYPAGMNRQNTLDRQMTQNRINRPNNYRPRITDREEFDALESRERELERIRRNRARARRKKRQRQHLLVLGGMLGCFLLLLFVLVGQLVKTPQVEHKPLPEETFAPVQNDSYTGEFVQGLPTSVFYTHPSWTEDFLSISEWARPGEPLPEIKDIFVHYTANRNTSAAQNRSYFEGLKDTHETAASAHFIIGYDGEIIQCIPLDEVGYAVKSRNYDSISIECCYKSEDGSFSQKTYDSLINMLKWLTETYDLTPEHILRHYDCGGKLCPIYYTENPDEWEKLKKDVAGR